VDTVVVVPAVATVSMGTSVTLQAEARDADGNLLSREAFWSAEDSNIVTVSEDGQVTGRRLGQVQVAASVEGKSGLSSITVSRTPVASVRLVPANASLGVGGTFTFTAEARDDGGALLTGRLFTWTSSNPQVASVNTSGRITAQSAGAAIISAEVDGQRGLASVNVTGAPAGQPTITILPSSSTIDEDEAVQLIAVYRDGSGQVVNRTFQWYSSDTRVARVNSSGRVTGRSDGSVTIRATSSGVSGLASVTVRDD
jgi:uncharacterized protein YjdB